MSDPRLSRLAELWGRSLEEGLGSAEKAELKSLLQDAALAEAWMEQQAGQETEPLLAASALPARLRGSFQRNFRPWSYWGWRLAAPLLLAGAVWALWPQDHALRLQEAPVDDAPYHEVERRAEAPAHKNLGPPPGLDRHEHLWVTRSGGAFQFDVELRQSAHLQADIFASDGRKVQSLDFGQQAGAAAHVAWDGRLADGQGAPAGRYRVKILRDGSPGEESLVLIEKK